MDSGNNRPNLRIESLYRHDVIMNSKPDIKTFQQTLLMLIAVFLHYSHLFTMLVISEGLLQLCVIKNV